MAPQSAFVSTAQKLLAISHPSTNPFPSSGDQLEERLSLNSFVQTFGSNWPAKEIDAPHGRYTMASSPK